MKNHSGLRRRLLLLGTVCAVAPLALVALLSELDSQRLQHELDTKLDEQARQRMEVTVADVLERAALAQTLLEIKLHTSLGAAEEILSTSGQVSLDPSTPVRWQATDQDSGKQMAVELPRFCLGGTWIGQDDSFTEGLTVPVVDRLKQRTGDTATLFQRMNEHGDMLRIATNVQTLDGQRAIGTYIPHTSPVVQTVLQGETYVGRAFVVNAHYVTAYKPLFDAAGAVIGILYVGTPDVVATKPLIEQCSAMRIGEAMFS